MRYYYADPTNNPVGPYQLEDLHQLHAEGVIQSDTLVAEEGGASWFPYRSLVIPPPVAEMPAEMPAETPAEAPAELPAGMAAPAYAASPAYSSPPPVGAGPGMSAAAGAGTTVGPNGIPQNDITTALFLHLSHLLALASLGVGLIAPILIWVINKHRSPFVDRHGVAYLNKLLSYVLYGVVSLLLTFVLIGIPMLVALLLLDLVTTIMAAVAANRGEPYEYPLTIKFMK